MPATSAQPSQSSTTVAYGMPTPEMPLSLPDMDITMETTAHTDRVDRGGYAVWDEPVPLTPAPEYTLRSPISLSRIPLKAPTQHECEAAENLLSLFSPRLESLLLPNESYSMDVEVQAPTPNDLGISATPLSPLPLSQDIPFNSSGCDDYSQNEQNIEMGVHVPRIRKERTSKVDTMLVALENLRKARISVMDLLLAILSGDSSEFYSHRLAFLCDSERIREILDIVWEEKKSLL